MSQSQRLRIARLEERLLSRLREQPGSADPERVKKFVRRAIIHATNLAFLILLGKPVLGEPLWAAWDRTGFKGSGNPFEYIPGSDIFVCRCKTVAHEIHSSVIPELPDLREKENLDKIFASAPAWLIWFTYGDCTTDVLGLTRPDLSSTSKFVREPEILAYYPVLPSGAFEYVRAPEAKPSVELHYKRRMSPRELKRSVKSGWDPSSQVRWPLNIDEPLLEVPSE
jgi:hypothetical protein